MSSDNPNRVTCPVCLNQGQTNCSAWNEGKDATTFQCDICGIFEVSGTALRSVLSSDNARTTRLKRAVLSHRIRRDNDAGSRPAMLMTDSLEAFIIGKDAQLPTPGEQATNIIRFIGDRVREACQVIDAFPVSFHASIGAFSAGFAFQLAAELKEKGLVTGIVSQGVGSDGRMQQVGLTLDGWERYDAELKGETAGKYGFIALQFGDAVLDRFLRDVIKPAVASVGYALEDMRDAARAGIIDNVMRARIRDAAFVLVDLTHANKGAYWESGYAGGLGKPVLYLCERATFNENGTHFDTNHCTTVMWDSTTPEAFTADLTATLRRSLGLFER